MLFIHVFILQIGSLRQGERMGKGGLWRDCCSIPWGKWWWLGLELQQWEGTKWTGMCVSSFRVNIRDWWWMEYVGRRTGIKSDGAWASGHANHWERGREEEEQVEVGWGGVMMSSVGNILSLWSLWTIQVQMKVSWLS